MYVVPFASPGYQYSVDRAASDSTSKGETPPVSFERTAAPVEGSVMGDFPRNCSVPAHAFLDEWVSSGWFYSHSVVSHLSLQA